MTRGFSVLELIAVVAITGIMAAMILVSFAGYRNRQTLTVGAAQVVTVLRDARSRTVNAKSDQSYGVHINTEEVVLFVGGVYNSNDDDNEVVPLLSGLRLATSSLGSSNITFSRLSGQPSVSGSLSIYRSADQSASTTISINSAGIISSP